MSGIALLSGGLDSTLSLHLAVKKKICKLALTIDYGQISRKKEISASKNICRRYGIKHLVIELPFLKKIGKKSGLVSGKVPEIKNLRDTSKESAKNVWVPNRNALFANIGASFCDAMNFKWVIMGLNGEEGMTFPDNSKEFVEKMNKLWESSTLVKPQLWVPLIDMKKDEILKTALEEKIDLFSIWACYKAGRKHCGICESCVRLKTAMEKTGIFDRFKGMFEK